MSQLRPTGFVDRLAERGLIDRWGFLCFAFGGAVFILLLKSVDVNTVLVSIGAAAAMLAYAILVQRSPMQYWCSAPGVDGYAPIKLATIATTSGLSIR